MLKLLLILNKNKMVVLFNATCKMIMHKRFAIYNSSKYTFYIILFALFAIRKKVNIEHI